MARLDLYEPTEHAVHRDRCLPRSARYFIGQDSRGNWVVQDQDGLHGGLFVSRAAALRFAMLENRGGPRAVTMVPGILELGRQQPVWDPAGGSRTFLRHHARHGMESRCMHRVTRQHDAIAARVGTHG